jgi:hypothetical protein
MGSDLNRYFEEMGARVKFLEGELELPRRGLMLQGESPRIALDIRRDGRGEYFEIRTLRGVEQEVVVLNAEPRDRHLVLLSRQFGERGRVLGKQKFLCGHDERHWFVAAIPESAPVSTVASAKAALKPEEVREREAMLGVNNGKESSRRRNAAFVRQGEWFFVPAADLKVNPMLVLRNEPIRRGNGSKAHFLEECYRTGGVSVYVSSQYPTGLTEAEYRRLPEEERKRGNFRYMRRDAAVFARGEVWHPDHATIWLNGWHRVWMNTENRARAMRNLVFLD